MTVTMKEVLALRVAASDAKGKRQSYTCKTCPPGLCGEIRRLEAIEADAFAKAERAVLQWIAQDCHEPQPDGCPHCAEIKREAEKRLAEVPCVIDAHLTRDEMPSRIAKWIVDTFGADNLTNPWERTVRVLEEAIELAQADGITEPFVKMLASRTYNRPLGNPSDEAGGVAVTLLAWAFARNMTIDALINREVERIEKLDKALVREKQRAKYRDGFGINVTVGEES